MEKLRASACPVERLPQMMAVIPLQSQLCFARYTALPTRSTKKSLSLNFKKEIVKRNSRRNSVELVRVGYSKSVPVKKITRTQNYEK